MKNILKMILDILIKVFIGSICIGGAILCLLYVGLIIKNISTFLFETISFLPIVICVMIGILLFSYIIIVGHECVERFKTYFKK